MLLDVWESQAISQHGLNIQVLLNFRRCYMKKMCCDTVDKDVYEEGQFSSLQIHSGASRGPSLVAWNMYVWESMAFIFKTTLW